ncbi:MAG: NADH-quinone oxidoreductase subunit J [Bdellovibrionaceae bacterium]|nr:NADH-quinone oxidoreductase subunit J [Pseudobdellovibrionaceae bacterium]
METFLFYFFSALLLFSAFKTISCRNPAQGALHLALSMILIAGIFFLMSAPFLAGLQLIIYAGAVMVLFVMVLMLFNLKNETVIFVKKISWILPVFLFGILCGLISLVAFSSLPIKNFNSSFLEGREIALRLFTEHLLVFEMIGLLLLVIAIGVVILSKLDKED